MYTIYEIPGVKIGCDYAWPLRAKEQGVNPDECIVLQQESDIIQVSIDELWWQIEKDYPVDTIPYWQTVEMNRKRAHKGGKVSGPKVGKKLAESGHLLSISGIGGKIGGKMLWINKNGKNTRVNPQLLQEYLDKGWIRGRIN